MTNRSITLFTPSLAGGGAERVFLTLVKGFLDEQFHVNLIAAEKVGELVDQVDPRAHIVDLESQHVITSLPKLIRYLKKYQPQIILSAQTHANLVVILAKLLANANTKIIVSEHNPFPERMIRGFNIKEWMLPKLVRLLYSYADKIVAVSQDIADSIPPDVQNEPFKSAVIHNPLPIDHIISQAEMPCEHPWLKENDKKVILAVGRLNPQKDYPTLLKSFSLVRKKHPSRLIILGEGKERHKIEELINKLELESDVSMPGFVHNPYPFMKQSDVFVLSSIFEGFGLVIVEAMACGIPVVATNGAGGAKEILEDGLYGEIVPIRDHQLMAEAIQKVLEFPPDTRTAQEKAFEFDAKIVIRKYIDLIEPSSTNI